MKKPADQGPVGPGWKLAWIEAVARDLPDAAGAPLAVAVVISSRVDSYGMVKNLTHPQIAKWLGRSVRSVADGYAALKARGYIEVIKESRGRGSANEVKIVRNDVEKSMHERASMHDPAMQDHVEKHARLRKKACTPVHTLPFSYPDSSLGGSPQEPAPIGAGGPDFLARCWRTVLERLSKPDRLGEAIVRSWLSNGNVAAGNLENGNIVLMAKSKFIADRNASDRADIVLREWQRIDPSVVRVTFKHGPPPTSESPSVAPAAALPEPKVLSIRERLIAKAAAGKAAE